ncbi:MAG: electron transport complex subunit RsxC [Deltaproteobacteria bacterium]|nr:electron transport complex subunit RsxC [Deltaproteobacteria bacterium]MBW2019577.1 electron transport complex subunit RsxC [Deltaproteobacteria bacterium]MBW2074401.1 electron transport complex subunit RsxC [Deltaproteobacteria bacterium]RLB82853.1 MAG: electron transport complex subunit RsxC [Deltaproteobacteria bacterium]
MAAETLATFPKGGIHPKESKELTEKLPVEVMPPPSQVRLFLKQHAGAPCRVSVKKRVMTTPSEERLFLKRHAGDLYQLLVKKKDKVFEGDLVGSVEKGLGANLHASLSGTLEGVENVQHPMVGKAPALVISADPEAEPRSYSSVDWKKFSREELIARIKDAGIVGLGGAGFPAHAKLTLGPDVKVDTLILNGAECEPYLTSDHRIMVEHPHDIIEGAKIILKILGIDYCAIGIENNKPDAIEALNRAIAQDTSKNGYKIAVKPLKVKYPQGSADQIMQSLTGRVRPAGARSSAIGIIVQNVYTTKAIYDAVAFGKPFYERVVTIAGKGIKRPANLMVKVGTSLADIVDYLGGTTPDLVKVVIGGPMMGFSVSTFDIPITKTTSGVLFLTKDEVDTESYYPCIRCGFCLEACPMGLEPNNIGIYVEAGRGAETEQFGIDDCFECGSCAFVCPAKRPLVQFIRLAKMKIRESKKK